MRAGNGLNRRLSRLEAQVRAADEARGETPRLTAAEFRDRVCFLAQYLLDCETVSLTEGYDRLAPAERLRWWLNAFVEKQFDPAYQTAKLCFPRSEHEWAECRTRKYRSVDSKFFFDKRRGCWHDEALPVDRFIVCDGLPPLECDQI